MKKITRFSVNYPISVLMIISAIILLGYISLSELGMDLLPDLNSPKIFVELKAGERSPGEIEQQFVESIESLAIRQKNVLDVFTRVSVGSAYITVTYTWNADMDDAYLDLQKALSNFSQNSEIDELILTQFDPNAKPIMVLSFSHSEKSDLTELRRISENYLRNELTRIEGIAAVEILGAEEREIIVQTSPYLMEAYSVTPSMIASKIQSYNATISGGSIVELGRNYVIKGIGEFHSLEDIENVIVTQQTQNNEANNPDNNAVTIPVYLKDIAKVSLGIKDPENIVRVDGEQCLSLEIYKETRFNTISALNKLREMLPLLQQALPGYQLNILDDQGSFIEDAIGEVEESALYGILLAVLILYVFLRRIGVTFIISIAIPISIIATFNLMYFNGLTLNIMTLGGLALGAGMLVDNAIVVMENIFRHIERGSSIKDAAILGTAEVSGAITASTLTTIIVFLPIVYLHGAAGELFKDQAWTVAFSLLSSLAVAILVMPMLSARLLKKENQVEKIEAFQITGYSQFLEKILERRKMVMVAALILVIISIGMLRFIGSEFIPKTSPDEFSLEFRLAPGSDIQFTNNAVQGFENVVRQIAGERIRQIYTKIGPTDILSAGGNNSAQGDNTAKIQIRFKPDFRDDLPKIQLEVQKYFEAYSDITVSVIYSESALQANLGTTEAPLVIEFSGDDFEQIEQLVGLSKTEIEKLNLLQNIKTDFDESRPEINLTIDREQAGLFNISVENIAQQLREYLSGKDGGQFEERGNLTDITLKMPKFTIGDLPNLLILSGQQKVRLDNLTSMSIGYSPQEILRRNQMRIGRIHADILPGNPLDKTVQAIEAVLGKIQIPGDYQYNITGEEQKRRESFGELKFALILSLFLIYMVLASQFESLIHPFTIILTIPLAVVGAIWLFFFLGNTLNIMAYIGIIMLVGIAVNDSIILVDAINRLKIQLKDVKQAVIRAGQRRIRPILMTSITTILALFPLTLGFGEGASLRAPMALAVIGGLVTSTLLTLVVIPCVYLSIEKIRIKITGETELDG